MILNELVRFADLKKSLDKDINSITLQRVFKRRLFVSNINIVFV